MHISTDTGKYHIWLEDHHIGSHILLILSGGEQPHIGGIVISEPHKPSQIIQLNSHLDHLVLQPLAEHTSRHYNTTVVATGGIHIDNASKTDIARILKNCNNLTTRLLKKNYPMD
ncbi:MAG: hypothetical protein KKC68_00935 [Candidatus Thermoplasmatota archaeon]|nr:hypothetical protein [Candidatus Thermoplasmatota archaeon]MBU1940316.1 hypothetical protein [Candidatus Thermoplasmatota archaeon]